MRKVETSANIALLFDGKSKVSRDQIGQRTENI